MIRAKHGDRPELPASAQASPQKANGAVAVLPQKIISGPAAGRLLQHLKESQTMGVNNGIDRVLVLQGYVQGLAAKRAEELKERDEAIQLRNAAVRGLGYNAAVEERGLGAAYSDLRKYHAEREAVEEQEQQDGTLAEEIEAEGGDPDDLDELEDEHDDQCPTCGEFHPGRFCDVMLVDQMSDEREDPALLDELDDEGDDPDAEDR